MSYPPRNFRPASRISARSSLARFRSRRSLAGSTRPSELIGRAHTLAQVSRAVTTVERAAVAVGSLVIASVAVWGEAGARAVILSGVGLLLGLVVLVAILLDQRHRLALDLIVDGQQWLPVRGMVRERDHVADIRSRARLARSYERIFEDGLGLRRSAPGPLPMVRPGIAARVLRELAAVAALLRAGDPGLRGVALAERLLIDGASPLYGDDVAALRAELCRARSLLRS
jgi:hypothetical protein